MTSPDPATFYENEGHNVMQALYEGLLQYAPNTLEQPTTEQAEIVPLLATDYSVSSDGLKYTFTLRGGVTFHDGTPVDSEAMKFSFERFAGVGGGPSYMLADVASYETPDPTTFIVNLSSPVDPFLDFVASPYGPRAMSPTAIKANEKDGDWAVEWIKTHDAGSGPYMIESWATTEYKLTAYSDYWGDQPYFKNVDIKIIPSFQTQQLQLEQGTLDIVVNGILPGDLDKLESQGLKTWVFDTPIMILMWINTEKGPFADPTVRAALHQAVDRKAIVDAVFGDTASVAKTMAPKAELPPGTATYEPTLDPSVLEGLIAQLPVDQKKVSIAYAAQSTVNQQISDLVQTQLAAAGFDATARGLPLEQIFEFPGNPDKRTDLIIDQSNGDGANPFTWYSLFYDAKGGLNMMAAPDMCPEGDRLDAEAYATASRDAAMATYVQADQAYAECRVFMTIADTKGIMAYRPNLTGLEHNFASQTAISLAKVRPADQ